jgi:hypothetical protein
MLLLPPANNNISILSIEAGLTAIVFGLCFCLPGLGSSFFATIERSFGRLARRRRLSVALVGVTTLLLRLALLPIHPIPYPVYTDDFSFLFAADTFAHGRLTNPTPAMWTHFETMHIGMNPTYSSMFFPAQGLILAAGKVLFGHPWYGLLCVTALMCAAICWMLQAWLPPTWALLGGLLVVLRLGLFSYWINTYTGAGAVSALGGALVLGALPRLVKSARIRDALLLAIGMMVLANSRPYEGLLLCVPVAFALVRWIFFGKNRPRGEALIRAAVPALMLIVAVGAWMAYYNYRNFGSPLTLPYTTDRATYAVAPHFIWESPSPEPIYRYQAIHDYYIKIELPEFQKIHSISGFLPQTMLKGVRMLLFYAEFALIPPLIMLRRVLLDRRIRFLVLCTLVLTIGLIAEAGIRPYYLAPFTAAFYAIGLQAMRHLKQWEPGGQPVGSTIQRWMVTLCIAMAALDVCAKPLHLGIPTSPGAGWACECLGPPQPGAERANIVAKLERLPGKHLVLVRYSPNHDAGMEWVYNSADIDGSKVIWAREMDSGHNSDQNSDQNADRNADQNAELIRYYKDRQVWLVQPDAIPATLLPYPVSAQPAVIASGALNPWSAIDRGPGPMKELRP